MVNTVRTITKELDKFKELTSKSKHLIGLFVGTLLTTGGALLLSSRHTLETVSSQMKPKYYCETIPESLKPVKNTISVTVTESLLRKPGPRRSLPYLVNSFQSHCCASGSVRENVQLKWRLMTLAVGNATSYLS